MRLVPLWAAVLVGATASACKDASGPDGPPAATPLAIDVGDLPPMPLFAENPTTVEGVALGRRLFHDPILSGDSTQSCGSCHQQALSFGDSTAFSLGILGSPGGRNTQVIVNPGWQEFQFWDGRRETLEDQARDPVVNPVEMNADWDVVVQKIAAHPLYPDLFTAAFGTPDVTQDRIVQAIAQFERTFVSSESRYDKYLRGDITLTAAELRGEEVFFDEGSECFHCHSGMMFTDNEFHDIGLDAIPADAGRAEATEDSFDTGKFKTPTLRNIARTPPYMHDGRFQTLAEVVQHYSEEIQRSPNLDPTIGVHLNGGAPGLELSAQDQADLIEFLETLTDEAFLANPAFGPPED